jgi:hypothetical protein
MNLTENETWLFCRTGGESKQMGAERVNGQKFEKGRGGEKYIVLLFFLIQD